MASRHWFREYFEAILIAGVFLAFTNSYLVKTFYIPSGSMMNTLLVGDHLFVNRYIYGSASGFERSVLPTRELQRGDIVIFRAPESPTTDLVKRCVGLPGDVIELNAKRLYVNGVEMTDEAYVFLDPTKEPTSPQDLRYSFGPLTVPPDQFFFMGDNRYDSLDSRFWGTAPRHYIKGRASIIYWSFGGETSDGRWTNIEDQVGRGRKTLAGFFTKTRWSRTFHLPR